MFLTAFKIGVLAIGISALAGCMDGNFPSDPAANSMHYGPSHSRWHHMHYGPPHSRSHHMHYGPPGVYYPPVTVTNRYDAPRSNSMHYGAP